jgi:hypothetical protein
MRVYAATRAGVEAMTTVLAKRPRGRNITVNAIAPGPTATDLFLRRKPPELVDRLAKLAPLERLAEPTDIAAAAAFLAGPDRAWINGQTLRANGGINGSRRFSSCLLGIGSPGRTRTSDPAVNSRLLYQLSYRGSEPTNRSGLYQTRALANKIQRRSGGAPEGAVQSSSARAALAASDRPSPRWPRRRSDSPKAASFVGPQREAGGGIEPPVGDLQSPALPLCYPATG